MRVLLGGEPPGRSHGVDLDENGNGLLRDARMYQLVRDHEAVRQPTLEIMFLEPGAEAYALTFGLRDIATFVTTLSELVTRLVDAHVAPSGWP